MTSAIGMSEGMSDVKRFYLDDSGMSPKMACADGAGYVRYDDYSALEMILDAALSVAKDLKQELAAAREELASCNHRLRRAGALVQTWRDHAEYWRERDHQYGKAAATTFADCAEDLDATLQRDRQP